MQTSSKAQCELEQGKTSTTNFPTKNTHSKKSFIFDSKKLKLFGTKGCAVAICFPQQINQQEANGFDRRQRQYWR